LACTKESKKRKVCRVVPSVRRKIEEIRGPVVERGIEAIQEI
jgi:hypothetical protein